MGILDWGILLALAAWLAAALRAAKRKKGCCGDCSRCRMKKCE